jgi:hypothetical protein
LIEVSVNDQCCHLNLQTYLCDKPLKRIAGTAGVPPAMSAEREQWVASIRSEELRACGALRAGRPRSQ